MSEKMTKQVEAQISDLNAKVDESNRNVNDLQSQKSRLQQESAELTRQLEDAEHRVGTLTKEKSSLANQLEEAKRSLEDETRVSCITRVCVFAGCFVEEDPTLTAKKSQVDMY